MHDFFMECGRKQEHPERTHTYMESACKLHIKRSHDQFGDSTQVIKAKEKQQELY